MSARSVKQVAQMAVTRPTSLNFLRLPRLPMGNLCSRTRPRQRSDTQMMALDCAAESMLQQLVCCWLVSRVFGSHPGNRFPIRAPAASLRNTTCPASPDVGLAGSDNPGTQQRRHTCAA